VATGAFVAYASTHPWKTSRSASLIFFMSVAVNSIQRSMGQPDSILSPSGVEKLEFINELLIGETAMTTAA
jgi:hypothetical protein